MFKLNVYIIIIILNLKKSIKRSLKNLNNFLIIIWYDKDHILMNVIKLFSTFNISSMRIGLIWLWVQVI